MFTANCSHVVTSALAAAGKPNGFDSEEPGGNIIPNIVFQRIVTQNKTSEFLEKLCGKISNIFW